MIPYVIIGFTLAFLMAFFFISEYLASKKRFERLVKEANESYGRLTEKKLEQEALLYDKKFFERFRDSNSIDDITASDLDLDEIYNRLNICLSAPGRQLFYYLLRTPLHDKDELKKLDKKVGFFSANRDVCNKYRALFLQIGNMRKTDFFECLDCLENVAKKNIVLEFLTTIFPIVSLLIVFANPQIGLALFIFAACINIVSYYKSRGEIEAFVVFFGYISNFLKRTRELALISGDAVIDETEAIKADLSKLKKFESFSFLVLNNNSANTGAGNPLDILLDYIKMIFHIDIFKFYRMLDAVNTNRDSLEDLYINLGRIEAYINIASIRATFSFCKPENGLGIEAVNIYHPLIKNPVKNSINTSNGVLITGSNASGKSTFLKTVALNVLFANTIYTCLADSFKIDDYVLFSSMSLRDDLVNKDSYFMVEIKALKRIFDFIENNPDKKVICFVDEVLRGTNTVERISAVTQILRTLSKDNVLCFAATHDIELTDLCADLFTNYHFEEEIIEDDISFNYLLKEGKATSRNAIRLLSLMGFSNDLVDKARNMAGNFTDTGKWSV